jgi:acylphosphatase
MSTVIARRARVEGRVQGVYYRASTVERAASLGLSGYARNEPDGSVEVLAVGDSERVAALLEWLWTGPPLARVTAVMVTELDVDSIEVPIGFRRG